MLNNFIYAKTKDLFLEELEKGHILEEAIVFIEDTREIWNHGTYFGFSGEISESIIVDKEVSDTSENAIANKAIKEYVDNSNEYFIPLSRDFSNDFNNDFAI